MLTKFGKSLAVASAAVLVFAAPASAATDFVAPCTTTDAVCVDKRLDAVEAWLESNDVDAPVATPTPTPAPTPAPVASWDATVTNTGATAGKATPITVKLAAPNGAHANKVLNVELWQNGTKVVQAFKEGVNLTGSTTHTLDMPAVPAGEYEIVVMVFADRAWSTRVYTSSEGNLTVTAAPVSGPAPVPPATPTGLYNPDTKAGRQKILVNTPSSVWAAGGSDAEVEADMRKHATAAAGKTMSVVVYNIPGRDGNNYSAGGRADLAGYRAYVDAIARGLGNANVILTIEPDALGLMGDLTAAKKTERIEAIKYANAKLGALPNAKVYVDAAQWVSATEMAATVKSTVPTGGTIDGVAVNVSSFGSLESMHSYTLNLINAAGLPWKAVIDTSRNGVATASDWCNPQGQGLGKLPTLNTGVAHVDAYLWIKGPGESDGQCGRNEPPAGQFWYDYAQGLIDRARH